MEWGDIDAGGALIALSAERMKARKQHRVPLTLPLALWLAELPRVAGCALIHDGGGQANERHCIGKGAPQRLICKRDST